jgi:hypothetical protein
VALQLLLHLLHLLLEIIVIWRVGKQRTVDKFFEKLECLVEGLFKDSQELTAVFGLLSLELLFQLARVPLDRRVICFGKNFFDSSLDD